MFSSVAGIGTNASTAKTSAYGIAGLVSGIDTNSIIKSLTTSAQARIDMAMQKKQKIQWKQDSYNSVIDKLNTFKSSYFDVLGTTNLSSTSAFNTWKTTSSSLAVTATSTSANTGAKIVISAVEQVASAYTVQSGSAASGPILAAGTLDSFKNKTLTFTLDGVSKTVNFGQDPQAALSSAFGLSSSGVTPRVQLAQTPDGVQISVGGSSKLVISGDATTLSSLGLKSGVSNRVDITKTVAGTSFAAELVGDTYEFTINGTEFSFSSSSSIMDIVNTINSSTAGVKLSYSDITDTFTLSSKALGTGDNITINQTKGNLLTAMVGVSAAGVTKIGGKTVTEKTIASTEDDLLDTNWSSLAGKSFDITIGGVTKTISLAEPNGALTDVEKLAVVAASLNNQIKSAFGTTDVRFEVTGSTLTLAADNNRAVALSTVDEAGAETALLDALGFASGVSNASSANSTLATLGITSGGTLTLGSETVSYTSDMTIDELINGINALTATTGITASFEDGMFALQSDGSTPMVFSDSGSAMNTLLGTAAFNGAASDTVITAGTNAVITLEDGTVIERNTNNFAVNGVLLQINEKTSEKVTISSIQDMDTLVNTMKKFVDEYNSMSSAIKTLVSEEVFKSYAPLTDAQREDMTESQIKLWEEKARSGVLKNDSTLNSLLTEMEDILNSVSETSGYSLEKMGFEFTVSLTEGTKLSLNEEKFRQVVNEDLQGVTSFFTQSKTGFSDRFATLIDDYAKSSLVDPGKLVRTAGSSVYTDGEYKKQLEELEDKITQLKNKLIEEETRLWKQFSAMETALSQLNSQSSWLTSLSGTGS